MKTINNQRKRDNARDGRLKLSEDIEWLIKVTSTPTTTPMTFMQGSAKIEISVLTFPVSTSKNLKSNLRMVDLPANLTNQHLLQK